MRNETKIKGDRNILIQDSKNSDIKIDSLPKSKIQKSKYQTIGLIVAIVTLIITIIIGWDNILKFFKP